MANAALIYPFQAPPQEETLVQNIFPFLSLPAEIRTCIYEFTIFPDDTSELFIINPMLDLSLLRVCKSVSREASVVLYTKRIAIISFLPDQYYLHGRTRPLDRFLRIAAVPTSDREPTVVSGSERELENLPTGHIRPDVLVRFRSIRLCLFFNGTLPKVLKQINFDSAEELKRTLEVFRDYPPLAEYNFPGRHSLELIVAINPQPRIETAEALREEHVREKLLGLGIPKIMKDVREMRTLKIGGNLTRAGLIKICEATCGNET